MYVYACKNLKASTIIEKLTDLFCMFGLPSYVHTDQGTNFMSYEFKLYLHSNDLQDDVNISLNQSDSNHEVENDVNQDQPKTPENKTQLRHSSRVRHPVERYGDPAYY